MDIIIEQDIYVNRAIVVCNQGFMMLCIHLCPFCGMCLCFAQQPFDMLISLQNLMRRKCCLNKDDSINKLILGLIAPRLGIEKSRLARHGANLLVYKGNCFAQVILLVSQIGTKSQIYLMQTFNCQLSITINHPPPA